MSAWLLRPFYWLIIKHIDLQSISLPTLDICTVLLNIAFLFVFRSTVNIEPALLLTLLVVDRKM